MPPDARSLRRVRLGTVSVPALAPFNQLIYAAPSGHTAFPTLLYVPASGRWWLWFKQATGHVTTDGTIKNYYSDNNWNSWQSAGDLESSATNYTNGGEDGALILASGVLLRPYRYNLSTTLPLVATNWRSSCKLSSNNGLTWGSEIAITGIMSSWWVPYGRAIEVVAGTIIMPGYGQDTGGTKQVAKLAVSTNSGATWVPYGTIATSASLDFNETALLNYGGGVLLAMVRQNNAGVTYDNPLYRVTSANNGSTWTAPSATTLTGEAPSLIRTASGRVYCYYRHVPSKSLYMAYSDDNAVTWSTPVALYTSVTTADMAYPSAVYIPASNKVVVAYYTASGATIRMLAHDPGNPAIVVPGGEVWFNSSNNSGLLVTIGAI